MKKYAALLCAALAGCSESTAIQDAVRETLIDPESARFGDIIEFTDDETQFACITVNSKNRMGGYSGERMWLGARTENGDWVVRPLSDAAQGYGCVHFVETMTKAPD